MRAVFAIVHLCTLALSSGLIPVANSASHVGTPISSCWVNGKSQVVRHCSRIRHQYQDCCQSLIRGCTPSQRSEAPFGESAGVARLATAARHGGLGGHWRGERQGNHARRPLEGEPEPGRQDQSVLCGRRPLSPEDRTVLERFTCPTCNDHHDRLPCKREDHACSHGGRGARRERCARLDGGGRHRGDILAP